MSKPDAKLVRAVMEQCNCDEQRAIGLLRLGGNDVSKAKRHHDAYSKYMRVFKPSPSTPRVPKPGDFRLPSRRSSVNSAAVNTPSTEESLPKNPHPTPPPPKPSQPSKALNTSASALPLRPSANPITAPQSKNGKGNPWATHEAEDGSNSESSETYCDAFDENTVEEEQHVWDFVLPELPPLWGPLFPGMTSDEDSFNPDVLAQATQHNATEEEVCNYLKSFQRSSVEEYINNQVEGFPPIFYAVETNSEEMVRLFIKFGADVSAVHEPSRTPLLAFAILNGSASESGTTAPIVSVLLSYGANPLIIPPDLFTPYARDPPIGPKKGDDKTEVTPLTEWCSDETRTKLAKAANITQRYYLERAAKMKKPSKKKRQIAQIKKAEDLLGVPYFLIGQSIAIDLLIQRLLTHLMLPSKQPLVLCFAGPSGHGKTELARQLGHLLSLELEVVDCAIVKREIELFGPREPYSGAEKGSPVNNFLASHSGQRCIVFMDEFEKTTRDIHQALLLPFDNGEYQDRRDHGKVDCSNTIWILATNALDQRILDFCDQNPTIFSDNAEISTQMTKKLSRELQETFLSYFGAPITGRVSDFVPFVPFSQGEQAVITHKFLLELANDLSRPIILQSGPEEQLVGDIRLSIRRDATVCKMLAHDYYHRKLGARSLKAGAKKVERIVLDAYIDEDEEIQENKGVSDFMIDVQGDELVGRAVKKTGGS